MSAKNALPVEGYSRLPSILGNPKAKPHPIPPLVPVSHSTWYAGITAGKFPRPVYIGRSALWKNSDLIKLLAQIENGELAE
jgi:hypothetical protein